MSGAGDGGGPDSRVRDFAVDLTATSTQPEPEPSSSTAAASNPSRVHYTNGPLHIDTSIPAVTSLASPRDQNSHAPTRSDTELTHSVAFTPTIRRRSGRAGTFRTVEDFDAFETVRPGWHPGAEPGLDPSKPDGGHASMTKLSAPCQITVVDFSQDDFSIQRLDNNSIYPFLRRPQPAWVKCRWINVNGLSWDVIQVLGRHKNLHKLAIEDIMNTRNRTKAEWFPTHAFIVLTLQKLVHTDDSDDDSSDSDDGRSSITSHSSLSAPRRFSRRLRRLFRRTKKHPITNTGLETGEPKHEKGFGGPPLQSQSTNFSQLSALGQIRTLQQYHTPANDPRTQFMERHSSLDSRNLAVACEQVSMFLTHDNCIISFFELSAPDVEDPILLRLQTKDTIIRQSCDASMVGQAIIDAIIDLAIPVTACYSDVIGDLELDVLTRPNLNHTKKLYIVITEINKMLSFINPIITLINALRDHKTDLSDEGAIKKLQDPSQGVIITPMTFTYLGDVLDHCVLITESLKRLKDSADGMIDLIFNTISAYQNESMRQLTVATIIFLPLTFLTGYFGQNFQPFDDLNLGISYFWKIAVPVVFATICILLRESIFEFVKSAMQRRYIGGLKRSRLKRRAGKRD